MLSHAPGTADAVATAERYLSVLDSLAARPEQRSTRRTPAPEPLVVALLRACRVEGSGKRARPSNVAERTGKADKDYTRTPPPSPGKKAEDKPSGGYKECVGCFGGGRHAGNQHDCWVSCRSARVPEGYHQARLNSPNWKEQQNALMRHYNLINGFPPQEWGITVQD